MALSPLTSTTTNKANGAAPESLRDMLSRLMNGYNDENRPADPTTLGPDQALAKSAATSKTVSFTAPGAPAPLIPQQETRFEPIHAASSEPYTWMNGVSDMANAYTKNLLRQQTEQRQLQSLASMLRANTFAPTAGPVTPALPSGAADLAGTMANLG